MPKTLEQYFLGAMQDGFATHAVAARIDDRGNVVFSIRPAMVLMEAANRGTEFTVVGGNDVEAGSWKLEAGS